MLARGRPTRSRLVARLGRALPMLLALALVGCGTVVAGRTSQGSAACLQPAALPSIGLPAGLPSGVPSILPSVSPRPLPSFTELAPPEPGLTAVPAASAVPSARVPPLPGLTAVPDPCPPSISPGATPGGPTPGPLPRQATDLHGVWFVDADHGWITGGDAQGSALVVSTSDGGRHWSAQGIPEFGTLNKVLFTDRNHGWASFLAGGRIVRTTDGGRSWELGSEDLGMTGDMTFADNLHGWLDTANGLVFGTSDGGRSWRQVSRPPIRPIGIFFGDVSHGWVVGQASSSGSSTGQRPSPVFATIDGGVTWQAQPAPTAVGVLTGVRFATTRQGWAVGQAGSNGVVLGTQDGGLTWVVEASVPGAFVNGAMTFRSNRYAWAAFGSQVIGTTDGVHWSGHPIGHNIVGRSRLSFGDPIHGWIAGSEASGPGAGYLVYTADGGTTWTELPIPRR